MGGFYVHDGNRLFRDFLQNVTAALNLFRLLAYYVCCAEANNNSQCNHFWLYQ